MKRQFLFMLMMVVSLPLFAQRTVEGTVRDARSGEALLAVSVQVKGTTTGTITDLDGRFVLTSRELTDESVILFSYVGYEPAEIVLGARTRLDVNLEPREYQIDELVVIGYGSVKKRSVIGAVTSVNAKELTKLPVAGVDQALQGRAAGVQVTQTTGAPGEGVAVRIRGTGSINSSNNPLYIVDGIPVVDALNVLSPGDIEKISVLKDASAAAIYGSRANNGVILITTTRGKKGVPQVTYRGQTGIQAPTRLTKMVNSADYVTIYNEATTNDNQYLPEGLRRTLISAEDAAKLDDVNYLKELMRIAPVNSHELTVSGGNESTNYVVSTSLYDQQGIIRSTGYTRGTIRLAINSDINEWLSAGMSVHSGMSTNDIIGSSGDGYGGNGGSVVRYAFFRNPGIPIRFEDGTFVDRPAEYFGAQVFDSYLGDGYNPIGMTYYNDHNRKEDTFLGSAFFTIKFTDELTFTTNLGMDYRNLFTRRFWMRLR